VNRLVEVEELLEIRRTRLQESRKFYRFLHESDEVAEWISDQTTIADSEDYGKDVEHVELIIQV
jgi:spectrin beta